MRKNETRIGGAAGAEVGIQRQTDRTMGSDWSRGEESRSELRVLVTVVSAAQWNLTGLHEYALHGLPEAVLAGARHGVNLPLTVDRTSVLLPRHWQQRVGGLVAEADGLLALPHGSPALNCPLVQVVAFSFVTKCAHLLLTRGKESKRHALDEKMRCLWFVKGTVYMDVWHRLKAPTKTWEFCLAFLQSHGLKLTIIIQNTLKLLTDKSRMPLGRFHTSTKTQHLLSSPIYTSHPKKSELLWSLYPDVHQT